MRSMPAVGPNRPMYGTDSTGPPTVCGPPHVALTSATAPSRRDARSETVAYTHISGIEQAMVRSPMTTSRAIAE